MIANQQNSIISQNTLAYVLSFTNHLMTVFFSFLIKQYQVDYAMSTIYRGLIISTVIWVVATKRGKTVNIRLSRDLRFTILRLIIIAFMNAYSFYLVTKLPMTLIMLISNTGPIFLFGMNFIFFQERISTMIGFGIVLAFSGVYAVYRSKEIVNSVYIYAHGNERLILISIFLFVMLLWSYSIIILRQLKNVNNYMMSFFVGLGLVFFGAFNIIYRGQAEVFLSFGLRDFALLLFTGCVGSISQFCFLGAMYIAPQKSSQIALTQYSTVFFSILSEILFFGEECQILTLIGSISSLVGVFLVLFNQIVQKTN